MLHLQLLGSPRITLGSQIISELSLAKSQGLLFYLAVTGRDHSRLALAGLLWPEKSDRAARINLRQTLRQLRVSLPDYVIASRTNVGLNATLPWEVDVQRFETQAKVGLVGDIRALEEAVTYYSGEFLSGFYVKDAMEFESWILQERESLRALALQVLQRLSEYYTERQEIVPALKVTRRLLAIEPWHEHSYRQMMRLLAWDGQVGAAMAQYETCRQIMAEELALEPAAETTALYEQIRAGRFEAVRRSGKTHVPTNTPPPPHNLPRQFTPFVGRTMAVAEIESWLADPACALVTICGPGGIGKTRLAVEVGRRCLPLFSDGAWFVELAPVNHMEALLATLAAGLNLEPSSRADIKTQVFNYLEQKELLLILDNFEHLLDGRSELMELLRRARKVKIIVTSQIALDLAAEWRFEVRGLAAPDVTGDDSTTSTAVQLFVQRLRQWQPHLSPTPADYDTIARICQLVEGVPLAIEMAASLARSLSYDAIIAAIVRDVDVLTIAHGPGRQHSLGAVFDYSWKFLNPREQSVLRKLSVFRGTFTTPAASYITGADAGLLLSLESKSFLRQAIPGRYAMHEVLRPYAAQKVDELGAGQSTEDRHCEYYLAFVRERESLLSKPGASLAQTEIQREWANVNAAWQRAMEQAQLSALEAARPAMSRYCRRRGMLKDASRLFQETADRIQAIMAAVEKPTRQMQCVLGRMLAEKARFLLVQACYEEAIAATQAALTQAQTAQDAYAAARGHQSWGIALSRRGELAQAHRHLEEALQQAEASHLPLLVASVSSSIGVLHFYQGDYETAGHFLERAGEIYQTAEEWGGEALVMNNLAIIAVRDGAYARAHAYYERALHIYRELGERGGEGLILANLGIVASHQGEFVLAEELTQQAMAICRRIGERWLEPALLNTLGVLQLRQGLYEDAATYLQDALHHARTLENQIAECEVLANLGALAHQQGSDESALEYCSAALQGARRASEQTITALAWMGLGRAQESRGHLTDAAAAYDAALSFRREGRGCGLACEAWAGLARIAWMHGSLEEALVHVASILACLGSNGAGNKHKLDGAEEPVQVYLTCYRILEAAGDERAASLLATAAAFLRARADRIIAPARRESFLSNVPTHRELLAEVEASGGTTHLAT